MRDSRLRPEATGIFAGRGLLYIVYIEAAKHVGPSPWPRVRYCLSFATGFPRRGLRTPARDNGRALLIALLYLNIHIYIYLSVISCAIASGSRSHIQAPTESQRQTLQASGGYERALGRFPRPELAQ